MIPASLATVGAFGRSVDPMTAAYINAMTVPPSARRIELIDDLVIALKAAGLHNQLDALYLFKSHDSQAARLNLLAPGTDQLVVTGTPVFTANAGVVCSTANYYTMNRNVNALTYASQNAFTQGVFCGAGAGTNVCGVVGVQYGLVINPESGGNAFWQANYNSNSNLSGAVASEAGLTTGLRNSASNTYLFKDGVQIAAGSLASVALPASPLSWGRGGTSQGSRVMYGAHIGGSMSSANILALSNALNTYFSSF